MKRLPNEAVNRMQPPAEVREEMTRPDPQTPEGCAKVPTPQPQKKRVPTSPEPGTPAAELQRLYSEYIRLFPEGQPIGPEEEENTPQKQQALADLLKATRQYCCRGTIRGVLAAAGLWRNDLDNEAGALFDAVSPKLMQDLRRRRSRGEAVVNFAGLAQRICRNHCIDYLRAKHPEQNGTIRLPRAGDYAPGTDSDQDSGRPILVDPVRPGKDGEGWTEVDLPDHQANVTRILESRLENRWLWDVLFCYTQVMLEYDGQPEKALGLCYGRVLYLMTGYLDPEFARFDDRAGQEPVFKAPAGSTSPVWAMKQMTGKTLARLRQESEAELTQIFGFPLRWGQAFCRQLETCCTVNGVSRPLADIPYDALCTVKQVRGWCNSIHNSLMPRACELILQDEELVDFCTENLPDTAKAFLNKGK